MGATTSSPRPSPRECRLDAVAIERWGLILALAAYALVQVNAVLHHGYVGQDFFHNTYR